MQPHKSKIFSFLRKSIFPILVNISLALGLSMVLIAISGSNPFAAIGALFNGAFGSRDKILETLVQSIPLIGVGLAIALGFTGGIFNIGAEGQFVFGAVACGLVGTLFPGLPAVVYIPLLLTVGLLAGAAWAVIPAIAKISRGVHEIISTIMMNYVAIYIVSFLMNNYLKVPGDVVAMERLLPAATIPKVFPQGVSRLSYSFLIILVFAVFVFILLRKSVLGYEIRAVGLNPSAGNYSGIRIKRTMLVTFLLSGALAGLAGGLEVIGLHGRYYDGFASGYGFAGIPIALLARRHPIGVIFAGIFMGALKSGALEMQIIAGVPRQLVDVIQGFIIVFVAGEQSLQVLREHYEGKARLALQKIVKGEAQ